MALPAGTVFKREYIGDNFVDQFAGLNRVNTYDADVGYADYYFEGNGGGDTLLGGHGDDLMFGDSGNDIMSGGYGFNSLSGGTGEDTLTYAFFDTNTVYPSTDLGVQVDLAANEARSLDTILELEDRVVNFENVVGSARDDNLYGNGLANDLEGGAGFDLLSGRIGNDFLDGGSGSDDLYGGRGADFLDGGSSRDNLYGGSGNDDLFGGSRGDYLSGGNGADDMDGETGDDRLYGGIGADDIYGGDGADDFVYRSVADSTVALSGRDFIYDFSRTELDIVDLSGIDAVASTFDDDAFDFIGRSTFSNTEGELRFRYGSTFTVVEGDTNGNGNADFAITFDGLINFDQFDFIA